MQNIENARSRDKIRLDRFLENIVKSTKIDGISWLDKIETHSDESSQIFTDGHGLNHKLFSVLCWEGLNLLNHGAALAHEHESVL